MSQTAIYSEISSGTLHQQELSVPLQATWLYNVANSFIFFSLLTLICEETGIKGRWEVNYNLKNIPIPAMAVHIPLDMNDPHHPF